MPRDNREPETWEIAGAFLGYFGIIGDVPQACKTLGIKLIIPNFIEGFLLAIHPNADRWYAWSFTLVSKQCGAS